MKSVNGTVLRPVEKRLIPNDVGQHDKGTNFGIHPPHLDSVESEKSNQARRDHVEVDTMLEMGLPWNRPHVRQIERAHRLPNAGRSTYRARAILRHLAYPMIAIILKKRVVFILLKRWIPAEAVHSRGNGVAAPAVV
eukprot:93495-Amorphochlora_amoeboformis.AAC.2